MRKRTKGQSTLEYIIVLAVIIAAIILFAATTFKSRYGNALEGVTNQMVNVVGRIKY